MKMELAAQYEWVLSRALTKEDDLNLWVLVFEHILSEIELLNPRQSKKHALYLQIGACSHWCRPNQTRWGDFAFPSGYGGGHSLGWLGLPEYDWFMLFRWSEENLAWQLQKPKFYDKRKLVCRVALPTRTTRHVSAAIHTLWTPGTPGHPGRKREKIYGYRKTDGQWDLAKSMTKESDQKWNDIQAIF